MTKLTTIDGRKKKPEELCEYCGEDEHTHQLMCPRITSVTYHEDGDVTVRFTSTKNFTIGVEEGDA